MVTIGSRVRVRDGSYEDAYRIVAPEDSDPATRSISQDSPMAQAGYRPRSLRYTVRHGAQCRDWLS